jgi:hypothetical protein
MLKKKKISGKARDAGTGEFVTREFAQKNPKTTVVESPPKAAKVKPAKPAKAAKPAKKEAKPAKEPKPVTTKAPKTKSESKKPK